MSIAIVKNQLADMKLFGMLGVLENALAEATRDQLSASELLNRLVQAEAPAAAQSPSVVAGANSPT